MRSYLTGREGGASTSPVKVRPMNRKPAASGRGTHLNVVVWFMRLRTRRHYWLTALGTGVTGNRTAARRHDVETHTFGIAASPPTQEVTLTSLLGRLPRHIPLTPLISMDCQLERPCPTAFSSRP